MYVAINNTKQMFKMCKINDHNSKSNSLHGKRNGIFNNVIF